MTSIVLTGMPGAGKSTIGVLLAKRLGMGFTDTDVLIQTREQKTLQQILNDHGYMALRSIEEQVLLSANLDRRVVATGGSAVYSDPGMQRLKSCGTVIYLVMSVAGLRSRIQDYETRGLAKTPEQTLDQLYEERHPLYLKYADLCVHAADKNTEQLVAELASSPLTGNCQPTQRSFVECVPRGE